MSLLALLFAARAAELRGVAQFGVAAFPAGIQIFVEPELRFPLWDSDHALLEGANVAFTAHAEITPAFSRGGPGVRLSPFAFWDLSLRAWGTHYFGTFSSLIPLESGEGTLTRDDRLARVEAGERIPGVELRIDASTRLKARVGRVVAVVEVELRRHFVRAEGLRYVWEPAEQMVIPADGHTLRRAAYLFWQAVPGAGETDRRLWIGVAGNWDSAIETGDSNTKLGPLVMWRPIAGAAAPLLITGTQAWLDSRFTGTLPPYSFAAAIWSK